MTWGASIPLAGLQPAPEQTTTQFVIPTGSATFSATNNVATITFGATHGLTMTPAGVALPNYYISFGGSTSGLSGTGILVGNYFRILSIPSTTAITIYTTITAATVTSMTGIPVFFPSFGVGSLNIGGQPTQTISSVVTPEPFPILAGCQFMVTTGANCQVLYNPSGTMIPLDPTTTTQLGGTPSTAPTMRVALPVSSQGQMEGAYPWMALVANGSTATTYLSVLR